MIRRPQWGPPGCGAQVPSRLHQVSVQEVSAEPKIGEGASASCHVAAPISSQVAGEDLGQTAHGTVGIVHCPVSKKVILSLRVA